MKTIYCKLDHLKELREFQFRNSKDSATHLASLRRNLRVKGELDPILVWREHETSKRLVILDGRYRVGAYRAEFIEGYRESELIPAQVFKGTRAEAFLAALSANAKDCLPLTNSERMNAAWALVIQFELRISKRKLSEASGVSCTTIARMRRVLADYKAKDEEPERDWLLAQNFGKNTDWSPPTAEEDEALIANFAQDLRQAFKNNYTRRTEIIAAAIQRVITPNQLIILSDHLGLVSDETWALWEDPIPAEEDSDDDNEVGF